MNGVPRKQTCPFGGNGLVYSESRCFRSNSAVARPGASRFASALDKFSFLSAANALLSRASNLVNTVIIGTVKYHPSEQVLGAPLFYSPLPVPHTEKN